MGRFGRFAKEITRLITVPNGFHWQAPLVLPKGILIVKEGTSRHHGVNLPCRRNKRVRRFSKRLDTYHFTPECVAALSWVGCVSGFQREFVSSPPEEINRSGFWTRRALYSKVIGRMRSNTSNYIHLAYLSKVEGWIMKFKLDLNLEDQILNIANQQWPGVVFQNTQLSNGIGCNICSMTYLLRLIASTIWRRLVGCKPEVISSWLKDMDHW